MIFGALFNSIMANVVDGSSSCLRVGSDEVDGHGMSRIRDNYCSLAVPQGKRVNDFLLPTNDRNLLSCDRLDPDMS